MKKTAHRPQRLPLVAAIAAVGLMGAIPAQAFQFDVTDEVAASVDTTLTYGAMWRVTDQDKNLLLVNNGGNRNSGNYDNGNYNYERGDLVSSLFKMTNDVSLDYKNFGAFFRVLSFYDHAIQNKDFDSNHADQRVIRNRLGHDYEIYDAYVRGDFDVAGHGVGLRVGKQVISWGESTFIPFGINTLNPVDVSKLRAPGSELKEAFLPIGMTQLALDISDNVSMELVHQYQFRATRLEPNGSYFSTNDFASPGGSKVLITGGLAQDDGTDPVIPRGPDKKPSGSGQYGVAFRVMAPELNNTEFGFYHANYHSRTPLISGTTPTGVPGNLGSYIVEYPEDIAMYGLSFNTLGPLGIALQGEYSYRPNQPLQLAANNLLNELLTFGGFTLGAGDPQLNTGIDPINPGIASNRNKFIEGYKRVKVHQLQMTATQVFGRMLGASQVVGVAEAGYAYLDLPSNLDFNGTGLDDTTNNTQKGIMTKNSYGYRALVRATYNNAIGAINLTPRVAFSHDVRGTSPTFTQGNKAVTVGLGADYQSKWQADLSYTNYFGGESIPSPGTLESTSQALGDRDFIAASVSYAF